jgi:hypothetical protein
MVPLPGRGGDRSVDTLATEASAPCTTAAAAAVAGAAAPSGPSATLTDAGVALSTLVVDTDAGALTSGRVAAAHITLCFSQAGQ